MRCVCKETDLVVTWEGVVDDALHGGRWMMECHCNWRAVVKEGVEWW